MSKMSQIHAELTEKAAELGFESLEEAEDNGYEVLYDGDGWCDLVKSEEPDINQAYEDLEAEQKANEEAYKVEMVWKAIHQAQEIIALAYKPKDAIYSRPVDDITDKKINDYYFQLNSMCIELSDRGVMLWQKEDNEN